MDIDKYGLEIIIVLAILYSIHNAIQCIKQGQPKFVSYLYSFLFTAFIGINIVIVFFFIIGGLGQLNINPFLKWLLGLGGFIVYLLFIATPLIGLYNDFENGEKINFKKVLKRFKKK